MRTLSFAAVCTINAVVGIRYCWLIRQGRISPALAMWVFFTIATVGSLLTYLGEGIYGPLDNILNTADIMLVGGVALWIAFFGDKSTRFTRFDLACLVVVAGIVATWAMTRQHLIAHSAIQAILVIGYFPVVRRLWKTDRNTESFTMWIGLMIAPAFSLLSSRGVLATVYAARTMVCTGLLLLLMVRAERRRRRGSHG